MTDWERQQGRESFRSGVDEKDGVPGNGVSPGGTVAGRELGHPFQAQKLVAAHVGPACCP